MNAHITIGQYDFRYVHQVSVESSWKVLADTCTIELPNVEGQLTKAIVPGDEVIVRLGYDGAYSEDFRGYVSAVAPTSPVRIECVDAMWKLRQETITMSWRSVSLADVVRYIVPGSVVSVPDVTLAPFRLDKVTRAEALQVVKEQYGLCVFYRGPELYVGLPYGIDQVPLEWRYHMQRNVASFGSLAFKRADDVKVKVQAISIRPDNSRLEVEVGDSQGEQHTLHFYNLTEPELRQQAEQKLGLMKYDGYTGAFTAFGFPTAQHSGIVDLADDRYPGRGGRYFIDAVKVSYGPNGYRREITLGKRASS
jgi:phage protein D